MSLLQSACRAPLISPEDTRDPIVRQVFQEIEQELGFGIVPNIFRALGNQPAILRAVWDLFRATVLEGILPRTLKEMIGVVVSAANGSEYALRVHLHSLGVQGIAQEVLDALAAGKTTAPGLSPSVVAVLRFAQRAVADGPLAVDDRAIAEVTATGISAAELNEVIATINLFRYVNGFTDLVRVPIDAV
ncbi:MAG: carboxymuconolactone decarboxylase [Dehalococcoidia bacterium]|nr:MAG: carboxymuconolactone decarboxylase [Dehalococcoidia bacterium]